MYWASTFLFNEYTGGLDEGVSSKSSLSLNSVTEEEFDKFFALSLPVSLLISSSFSKLSLSSCLVFMDCLELPFISLLNV